MEFTPEFESAIQKSEREMATGIRPRFLSDLKAYGIDVPSTCFDPSRNL